MDFRNTTSLDDATLLGMILRHTEPYDHDRLTVRIRNSRGSAFSGTCYYRDARIFVNIGRKNCYPFTFGTCVARAASNHTHWWREIYQLTVADPFQLALFVYLHELYHFLVVGAGRNPRRKESMCDRFAAAILVDHYGATIRDSNGRTVDREAWDIKDTAAFVAEAPRQPAQKMLQFQR